MNISTASRIALAFGFVFGVLFQLITLGLPLPATDPTASMSDMLLGPVIGVVWGMVGYILKAFFFGLLLVLALKCVRIILDNVFPDW
jgi:uncharacterized membrane protein